MSRSILSWRDQRLNGSCWIARLPLLSNHLATSHVGVIVFCETEHRLGPWFALHSALCVVRRFKQLLQFGSAQDALPDHHFVDQSVKVTSGTGPMAADDQATEF